MQFCCLKGHKHSIHSHKVCLRACLTMYYIIIPRPACHGFTFLIINTSSRYLVYLSTDHAIHHSVYSCSIKRGWAWPVIKQIIQFMGYYWSCLTSLWCSNWCSRYHLAGISIHSFNPGCGCQACLLKDCLAWNNLLLVTDKSDHVIPCFLNNFFLLCS